jgi:hypothetical protein
LVQDVRETFSRIRLHLRAGFFGSWALRDLQQHSARFLRNEACALPQGQSQVDFSHLEIVQTRRTNRISVAIVLLETGPIDCFTAVGNDASYALRDEHDGGDPGYGTRAGSGLSPYLKEQTPFEVARCFARVDDRARQGQVLQCSRRTQEVRARNCNSCNCSANLRG